VRKYLILSALLVVFLAFSFGTANAVWKIGGTGPFLNYPFYIEGAVDGVSFKTYAVLNNVDLNNAVDVVAAIHYVVSDNDGDLAITMADLGCQADPACPYVVDSEFQLRDTHLTETESRIIVPGVTNPSLGPEVTVWSNSAFTVGWMEIWGYYAGVNQPFPPDCLARLRGEAITVDLGHSSAWTYKAVASVTDPNGATSDMWSVTAPTVGPAPGGIPSSCPVAEATFLPPRPNPAPPALPNGVGCLLEIKSIMAPEIYSAYWV
jgi:hypothetical protein